MHPYQVRGCQIQSRRKEDKMKTSEELKKFIETELKHCQRDIRDLERQYAKEEEIRIDTMNKAEEAYYEAIDTFVNEGLSVKEAKKEAEAYYDAVMSTFNTNRMQIIEANLDYTREMKEAMELALIGWNTENKNDK